MGTELDWFRPAKSKPVVSPETRCATGPAETQNRTVPQAPDGAPVAPEPPAAIPSRGPLLEQAPPPIADDLVADWLGGMKPTSQRGYLADAATFAQWAATRGLGLPWGERPADVEPGPALNHLLGLGPGDANRLVLAFKNDQLEKGLSSATIGRRLAALKSFVRLARKLGRVSWDLEIRPPSPEPRRDVKGPDADELKRIRKALAKAAGDGAEGKRDRALVALLYGLGLRRAEAVGIDMADLDFEAGSIKVLGKGRREKVALKLSAEVARDVGAWVLARGSEPGPLFFALNAPKGRARQRLNLGTVNRIVDRLGKAAGLPGKLRPHGFRHAAITTLFRRKKTLAEVMSFSRHKDPKIPMRYHDGMRNSAAEMADELGKDL